MSRERVWTIVTRLATGRETASGHPARDTGRGLGMSKTTPITRKDVPAVTE
jgi:hypothetical protein